MIENFIKERRTELGVTQEWLAERSGVGRSTISEIENGKHIPDVEEAIAIARALNTIVEKIFIKKV